jgi:hypothetical protein
MHIAMFTPNLCRPGVAALPAPFAERQLGLRIQDFALVELGIRKLVVAASTRAFDRGRIKAVAGWGSAVYFEATPAVRGFLQYSFAFGAHRK